LMTVTTGKYPSRGWKPFSPRPLLSWGAGSQQANTPHGDGNLVPMPSLRPFRMWSQQANTPHGDGNTLEELTTIVNKYTVTTGKYPSRGWKHPCEVRVNSDLIVQSHNRQIPLTGMETPMGQGGYARFS